MKPLNFPEAEWLSNLLKEEDRQTYASMSTDQQRLVRFAMYYGALNPEQLTGKKG